MEGGFIFLDKNSLKGKCSIVNLGYRNELESILTNNYNKYIDDYLLEHNHVFNYTENDIYRIKILCSHFLKNQKDEKMKEINLEKLLSVINIFLHYCIGNNVTKDKTYTLMGEMIALISRHPLNGFHIILLFKDIGFKIYNQNFNEQEFLNLLKLFDIYKNTEGFLDKLYFFNSILDHNFGSDLSLKKFEFYLKSI